MRPRTKDASLSSAVVSWRIKLATVLALMVWLLPATSLGRVLTYCNMSGRLGETCCCHGDEHVKPSKVEKRPQMAKRPGCCEQRLIQGAQGVTAHQPEGQVPVMPGVLIAELSLSEIQAPAPQLSWVPRLARGPPPLGPPLYIRYCSLLN